MGFTKVYSNVYDKLWMKNKYNLYIKMYTKNPKRLELQNKYPLSDSQKKQIDEYYMTYYGSKIPYECHQNFAAHTGVFIPDYFADFLFVPYFEHFINEKKNYASALSDKSVLPYVALAANVKMPKLLLSNTYGIFRDAEYNCLKKDAVKN